MKKNALRKAYYSASEAIKSAELSFQSQHDYKRIIYKGLEYLNQQGFTLHSINQLKQKHFDHLVNYWKEENLSNATIKNRLSAFRLIAGISGRKEIVKTNDDYGIDPRNYIPNNSKAIHGIDMTTIADPYIRASLELQKEFGLRREESIKFKPHQADEGMAIRLQASWTKGGIERIVPITTISQRECLNRVKELVNKKLSLIPQDSNYKKQKIRYDNMTQKAELHNLHGLRHAYAQKRYETLTNELTKGNGWKCPIDGGPHRIQLNPYEKFIDRCVREKISFELGHSRIGIVKSYIGI